MIKQNLCCEVCGVVIGIRTFPDESAGVQSSIQEGSGIRCELHPPNGSTDGISELKNKDTEILENLNLLKDRVAALELKVGVIKI